MYMTHTYTYTYAHIQLNNLREEIQVVYHKEMFNKEVLLDCQNEKNKLNVFLNKAKIIYEMKFEFFKKWGKKTKN